MIFSLSGFFFLGSSILLSFFSYDRYKQFRTDPSNRINLHYFRASFFVSLALFLYGAPSLISRDANMIAFFGILATLANAVGFGHFLLVPLFSWLGQEGYLIARFSAYIFTVTAAIFFILLPPATVIGRFGVIHWRFHLLTSVPVLFVMVVSFVLNVFLLLQHFKRLKSLSVVNVFALILTFSLTGVAGSYLFVGDHNMLLALSSVMLCLGIVPVYFSALYGGESSL